MTRKKKSAPHPIGQAIEDVLAAGHTPRIHVDARRNDVTVPDHVRERWQARLVIDLDPSWPLNLEQTEEGVEANLAFQGLETRCKFGWGAIYVVMDRATGRGMVVEAQLPPHELDAALKHGEPPRPKDAKAHTRPTLVPVEEPAAPASLPTPKEPPKRRKGSAASAAAVSREPPAPPTRSSDEEARERRARFRVIPGGG